MIFFNKFFSKIISYTINFALLGLENITKITLIFKSNNPTLRLSLSTIPTSSKLNFFSFLIKIFFWRQYIYLTLQPNYSTSDKSVTYKYYASLFKTVGTKYPNLPITYARLNPSSGLLSISKFRIISTIWNFNFNFINTIWLKQVMLKSFSFGFIYLQGFTFLLFIDACLTDDEPLWEPIEWSLVQTWILFIFLFAWVAENLIVSRYGSYTGRDKRVWMAWYKTFWLVEGFYVLNYGVAILFVIVPFYYEVNYNLSFVYSWWHWYSRTFFFKFISLFSLVFLISYFLQINLRWITWKQSFYLVILINIFLAYLLFTHFIITFFGYFADPIWYQKTRPIDYIQLSHEPLKWGWGSAKKDHFTYHGVKTVLWFKNDGPFATSFLFFQLFLFVCIFFLYIWWVVLFRRLYSMKEIPLTLTTYCVSSLKQFFFFFLYFYIFILMSYLSNYWRLPIEFFWTCESYSWVSNFICISSDYLNFILNCF